MNSWRFKTTLIGEGYMMEFNEIHIAKALRTKRCAVNTIVWLPGNLELDESEESE